MSFEEQLSARLKQLSSKHVSDKTIDAVINKLEHDTIRNHKATSRGRWGITAAALAAVAIVGIALHNIGLFPLNSESAHSNFPIVKSPLSMSPTPLDTKAFQHTLRNYLERHDISNDDSSTTAAVSNQAEEPRLPVINKISEPAVRWSQLIDNRYGAATVTFLGNGKPRIANVLALKNGANKWSIEQINNLPATVTSTVFSRFFIYPGDWGGTGFVNPLTGDDRVQFSFLSGLVVDPSITRVQVVWNDGTVVNLPIVNGTYGYFQVATSEKKLHNDIYTLRAYNKSGVLIFQH